MSEAQFLSTLRASEALGCDRTSVWRMCEANPGFGMKVGSRWKVAVDHVRRMQENGETPAQIAANPSPGASGKIGAPLPCRILTGRDAKRAAEARVRLVRMYLFARAAAHYADDVSEGASEFVLNRVAEDALAVLKEFDLLQGASLRDAIADSDCLEEFFGLTGIQPEI